MKVCHLCGDTYKDHVDFCFNDGEVLAVADPAGLADGAAASDALLEAPTPRRTQGAQGVWADGTPVPVPRNHGRPTPESRPSSEITVPTPTLPPNGPASPNGPGPSGGAVPVVAEDPAAASADDRAEPRPTESPVPADNDPRQDVVPRPPNQPSEEPPAISVPAPSIRATPQPAGPVISPLGTPASLTPTIPPSQVPTPVAMEHRDTTRLAPGADDAPRQTRASPPPPQTRRSGPAETPRVNVRVVSGAETDGSNLLWLGAMFAVGVLFALVGGSIPLLYMVYSGGWSGSPSAGAPSPEAAPVAAEAVQTNPALPVPVPVPIPPEPELEEVAALEVEAPPTAPRPLGASPAPKQRRMTFKSSPGRVEVVLVKGDNGPGNTIKPRTIGTTNGDGTLEAEVVAARQLTFEFRKDGCWPAQVSLPDPTRPSAPEGLVEATLACAAPEPAPAPAPAPVAPQPAAPAPAIEPEAEVRARVMVMVVNDASYGITDVFVDGARCALPCSMEMAVDRTHQCRIVTRLGTEQTLQCAPKPMGPAWQMVVTPTLPKPTP